MSRRSNDSLDASLNSLVDALAVLFVSLGVTPGHLAQISRVAFVKAASSVAKKRRSGSPHLARIASLTGLSRAEVKRIVSSGFQMSKMSPGTAPRALRVLEAWRTDKRFSRGGRRKTLKLSGFPLSFEALCKGYSGDIPPKAILAELERAELVRVDKQRNKVSYEKISSQTTLQADNFQKLAYAASLIKSISSGRMISAHTKQVASNRHLPASYIRDAVVSRVETMITDLPTLFPRKRGGVPRKGSLRVFAVITEDQTEKEGVK
jgi:hypothetical protein